VQRGHGAEEPAVVGLLDLLADGEHLLIV
jgi:hypothetical protein